MRKWDGKVSVFEGNKFPTGLVPEVAAKLVISDIIIQRPPKPLKLQGYITVKNGGYKRSNEIELRDYQSSAINSAFSNTYGGSWWPRGIIKVATGGGKTEIACSMIKSSGARTLFLVHRKDLLTQTIDRFNKYGLRASQVGSGQKDFSGHTVVATVQTLWKMFHSSKFKEEMKKFDQLFIDEAHLVAADLNKGNIFVKVASAAENAYMRWGLTATPMMKDDYSGLLLRGVTGEVLYEITNRELIEKGYLSEATVEMIKMEPPKHVVNQWPACYETGIMTSDERNKKVVEMAMQGPHPCLILVQRTSHGRILKDMFNDKGKVVPFVHGSSKGEYRKDIINLLTNNQLDIAIASTIWDEGVDIPSIRTLILAGGGKSVVKNMQRLGRSLRRDSGKSQVRVVDFYDTAPRWLRNHSNMRKGIWEGEGFLVKFI
jgi:superfamily II DNA or RNA helicase